MFTAALFSIAKTWKQPKCPLTDEQIKKFDTHTQEYYSTIKKEGNPATVTTWIEFEGLMLSEIGQTKKTNTV